MFSGTQSRDSSPTPSRRSGIEETLGDLQMAANTKVNRGLFASVRRTKERLFGNSTAPTNKHDYEDELTRLAGLLREPQRMLDHLARAVHEEVQSVQGLMASLNVVADVAAELGQEPIAMQLANVRAECLSKALNYLGSVADSIEGKNMQLRRIRENLKARSLLATDFRYYKRKLDRLEEERAAAEAADPPKAVDEDRLVRNKAKFLRIKEELIFTTKALIGEISSISAVGKAYVRPEILTVARITASVFQNAAEGTRGVLDAPESAFTLLQLNDQLVAQLQQHATEAIDGAQRVQTEAEQNGASAEEAGNAMLRDYTAHKSPRAEANVLVQHSWNEPPQQPPSPPAPLSSADAPRSPTAGGVRLPYPDPAPEQKEEAAGAQPPLPPRRGGGGVTGGSRLRSESDSSRESRATEFQIMRPTEIDPVIDTVTVEHSYQAEGPEELSIAKGDQIEVMQKDTSGWWRGQRVLAAGRGTQQSGWFPASHIQK